MTESQEPSYYEIALTNRQVLVAFVILLCCVLAAFFAGIWVGRGSPASAAEPQQAAAKPTPGQQPQELAFFNEAHAATPSDRRPDLQALAHKPRHDTTLAQDLGVEKPGATPAPAAVAGGGEPAGGEPAPASSAAVVSAPSVAPAPPPSASPAAAAGGHETSGSLFIQVFSSRDQAQAQRLVGRLKTAGLRAFLAPAGAMYRVRIGPFAQRSDAEAAAAKARREFRVDTWITATP